MNSFLQNLTNSDNRLLVRRAESVNSRAKMAQESLISSIRMEIENKKLKLDDLMYLGPDSTTSLSPCSATWNPNSWVNEIQSISLEIRDLTEQCEVAIANYKRLFDDVDEHTPTPNKKGKNA